MGISEHTVEEKRGEASRNDSVEDSEHAVDILRRRRHQAFREVGFSEVAEHKAVSGYTTIVPSSSSVGPTNNTASDSGLSTPLIDISNLGGNSGNSNAEQNGPVNTASNPQILVSPEAGLHRDGEQARLVEEVRQRQLQQRQFHEETTLQWLEESASQFWESMLVYGGLIEDPRNEIMRHSRHSTMPPVNPYRDNSRPTTNNNTSNNKRDDKSPSTGSKKQDRPTAEPTIETDGHSRPPSHPEPFSKRPRIIRFVFLSLLRIFYALRWSIDCCVARVARLDPLLPASLSTYSTSPTYSLQITADGILSSTILLWIAFCFSSWMQLPAGLTFVSACVFIGFAGRNASRFPVEQQSSPNENQSTARKVATAVATKPMQPTPKKAIASHAVQRLQEKYPDATYAECKRFFNCVNFKEDEASKRLGEYFKWRSDCGLKTKSDAGDCGLAKDSAVQVSKNARVFDQSFVTKDQQDWDVAAKMAISIITKSHESAAKLPQIICSYEDHLEEGSDTNNNETKQNDKSSQPPPRCKDGTRILHILPFRLDLSIATAPTYSLAAAIYIDRRFSRSTTERITLFSDVRSGRGWTNPTPWSMLPFVQSTASILGSNYPERLERLVLFPMPKSAIWVWSAAQKCLDPNTASKVVIVKAAEGDALPEGLADFIDEESMNVMEQRRRSFFVGQT